MNNAIPVLCNSIQELDEVGKDSTCVSPIDKRYR